MQLRECDSHAIVQIRAKFQHESAVSKPAFSTHNVQVQIDEDLRVGNISGQQRKGQSATSLTDDVKHGLKNGTFDRS